MPMVALEVVLRDSTGNEKIAGKLIVDDDEAHPFDLPTKLPIDAGRCKLEARCTGRSIKGNNPRVVEVTVPIDPGAPAQKEIFELL
jgi:hypothetical protein